MAWLNGYFSAENHHFAACEMQKSLVQYSTGKSLKEANAGRSGICGSEQSEAPEESAQ